MSDLLDRLMGKMSVALTAALLGAVLVGAMARDWASAVGAQTVLGPIRPIPQVNGRSDDQGSLMINPGVGTTPGSSTTFTAGTANLTTVAAAIGGSTITVQVLVQADPDNSADVLCGNSTSQPIQLQAAMGLTMYVTNLNLVYCKMVSGTGTVGYITR